MNARLEVHAVKVGGFPIYTCQVCSRTKRGDWFTCDIAGALPTQDSLPKPGPHYMPVGWASYGSGNYKCEECKQ